MLIYLVLLLESRVDFTNLICCGFSSSQKAAKAVVGQKVVAVTSAPRVRISYNYKEGDSGSCMIKMNGRKVKAWYVKKKQFAMSSLGIYYTSSIIIYFVFFFFMICSQMTIPGGKRSIEIL